ncbi:type VII secretion integral membrane protein EccD [Pseudonocardia sp. GCM10023141]|uniref:type VII secretion integral membrane protein EccD n=1 Tax=Pseudonocardia sp. GCM10023141 TaxID=3252653 RepID=UPI00361DDD1E
MAGDGQFCRLTVLAPRTRVDVALPADVPVAELLPMVLELVGEPAPVPAGPVRRPLPWRLSGAAGGPLPVAATLAELGVLDGELLRVGPADAAPPPPVFDDPVDALAATAGSGSAGEHPFPAAVVLTLVVAAAGMLAWTVPGLIGAGVAAVAAAVAVAHAARLVREPGPVPRTTGSDAARTAALAAVPLAAAAGWAASGPSGGVLLAVTAAGVAAAAAQVVLRVVAPVLVGIVVAAVPAAAAAVAVRFGVAPAAAAAAVAAVAVAAGPILPRIALRLAGLPRPLVPADGDELVDADSGPDLLPPHELAERADLARGYLAGLVGGWATVAAAGAATAAAGSGWAGPAVAGVTVAVLALRSRGYADRAPTRASLLAAITAAVALAVLLGGRDAAIARPLAGVVLLVAGGAGLLAMGRPRRVGSPVARRAVDWLEALLVTAAVPLAFGAMDLYRIFREQ